MWPTLGLLAALFNFIPNFGPMISFIPAVLFALADDPEKVLWVAALYLFAQSLEGYVLTPLVQRKAVELPPALLILTQVLMGTLGGGIGLVLAAPLTAAALVVIKMAYVREALDDPVKVPSEHVAEEKEEREEKKAAGGAGDG
jgi:predicted PurR-regulated permease PerM